MRKITPGAIAHFSTLTTLELLGGYFTNEAVLVPLASTDLRGVTIVAGTLLFFYAYAIAVFRLLHALRPFPTGEVARGTRDEHRAYLYILFHLLVFNPLLFARVIPAPVMRPILQALGARMGTNSFSVGLVMDPLHLAVGKDSIIGNSAMLIAHVIEGDRLAFYPIRIGDGVTVGAGAIVMADVVIEDGATVAVQSVVSKGTRIPSGEIWGGTPARRLNKQKELVSEQVTKHQ